MPIPKHDEEIKELTFRLKVALAKKKGENVSHLVKKVVRKNRISIDRFADIVYRFPCPRCHGTNTKRFGLTTQIETKARIRCLDCHLKRSITKDKKIKQFFVLTNKEMKDSIGNNISLSKEKKKFFLDRYLIK